MPGWHDAIKDLYDSGELQVVGIIQEQHPERCRLFMQWKQMGWPILIDSLNLLEVSAVPITVAIDEHGIVRHKGLRLSEVEEFRSGFMKTQYESPAGLAAEEVPENWPSVEAPPPGAEAGAWREFADLVVLSGDTERIDEAVDAYEQALELEPGDGWTHFRLGVALRTRYDSELRGKGDFQQAIDHWKAALDVDPNQYIWRRRIQQYGPRLDKPYPFYDWVPTARKEVAARGETPFALLVEPGGAEFAQPQEKFESAKHSAEPDPKGRIHRDDDQLIAIETVAAPGSIKPGEASRLHLIFRPRQESKAHWNNEVNGVELWLNRPEGCELDNPFRALDNPAEAVSQEDRKVEVEVRCAEDAAPGLRDVEGYALYYVCEDIDGTCLYRRQDFSASLEVR